MSLAYDFDTPVRAVQTSRSVACNDTLDLMERMGVRLVFAKDEEIYGQDEAADLIYRVVKGAVRTSRLMSDGRRQIGDFHYEGDLFGLEDPTRLIVPIEFAVMLLAEIGEIFAALAAAAPAGCAARSHRDIR